MTEEQIEIKSREFAEGRGHEHYNFLFEENVGSPVDFARLCYADGLKDGATEATKELQEKLEESERRVANYRTWVDKIKALKCVKIGKCADELQELQEQIEKMKCCINDLVHLGEFNENTDEEYLNYQVHEALKNAEQFIKE